MGFGCAGGIRCLRVWGLGFRAHGFGFGVEWMLRRIVLDVVWLFGARVVSGLGVPDGVNAARLGYT